MALLRDTSEMNIEPSRRIFSNLPKDGIRLVHIQQGSIVDDMECRVEEATLSDTSLSYEALSYVWGTFDMKKYISVNGERFRVTSNLAEALRMLRQPDKEVTMWIDAVCVNQTDKLEKNTQIPLMGRIYKSAAKVVAFLGKHDETSLKLFNVLMQKEEIDLFDLYLLQSAKQSLLRREYWQRAWIVQEKGFLLKTERVPQRSNK
ncbi:hypothetical protein N7453_001955 [Penicillium expansum]|nr:hypothetical protein N7453_001955 [Penicillium expansum]